MHLAFDDRTKDYIIDDRQAKRIALEFGPAPGGLHRHDSDDGDY